jgi:hypothetical protein
MLAYYHMQICISLRQLGQTIFNGIIALFDLELIHHQKVYMQKPSFILMEITRYISQR